MKPAIRIITSFILGYFVGYGVSVRVTEAFPLMNIYASALLSIVIACGTWTVYFLSRPKC